MSAAAQVPVEEYLRSTEKPYCEYRDGVLFPKTGGTWNHGAVQGRLGWMLHAAGLNASLEVHLKLSESKYLLPDVAAADSPQPAYPTEPVLLCCEILSPDDHLGAMLAKCEEYHEWGVPSCWVLDPEKRSGWEYHKGGEPNRTTTALEAGEIRVSLPELFSVLD